MSGQGVVLSGLGRDQRPQGSIGSEDTVVAVAVDAGWRKDRGEPVEELESRETQGSAAGAVGGLDTHTPIQTEPAPVLPAEHILGLVGFQEAVAGKAAKDSLLDGVPEAF
jgi:hypothetical protein